MGGEFCFEFVILDSGVYSLRSMCQGVGDLTVSKKSSNEVESRHLHTNVAGRGEEKGEMSIERGAHMSISEGDETVGGGRGRVGKGARRIGWSIDASETELTLRITGLRRRYAPGEIVGDAGPNLTKRREAVCHVHSVSGPPRSANSARMYAQLPDTGPPPLSVSLSNSSERPVPSWRNTAEVTRGGRQ